MDVDHAWAAGVIDGEGCITIGSHLSDGYLCHALWVKVAQVSTETAPMLIKLQELYGGSIGSPRATSSGRLARVWVIGAKQAEAMLREVLPYLVQKRGQAELALSYRENAVGRGKAELAAEYKQALAFAKT